MCCRTCRPWPISCRAMRQARGTASGCRRGLPRWSSTSSTRRSTRSLTIPRRRRDSPISAPRCSRARPATLESSSPTKPKNGGRSLNSPAPSRTDGAREHDALARQPGAIVRRGIIDRRSLRDDAHGVESRNRPIIDDVVARLHGLGDAGHLVEVAHVVCEIGVIGDPFLVASKQRGRAATCRRETPDRSFPPTFGAFLVCNGARKCHGEIPRCFRRDSPGAARGSPMKLTKDTVTKLTLPADKRDVIFFDDEIRGL